MEKPTKKTKILLWCGVMTLLLVLGIIAYRRLNREKGYTDTMPAQYNCRNTRTAPYPLTMGSNGWQVELLQRISNNCPDWNVEQLTEDGIWGEKTNEAFINGFGLNIFSESSFESYINYYKVYLQQ